MTAPEAEEPTCCYCGKTDEESELRPYGPGGSCVCFDCAMSTPERKAQTDAAFGALLDATSAISPVVGIGSKEGPVPFDPSVLEEDT